MTNLTMRLPIYPQSSHTVYSLVSHTYPLASVSPPPQPTHTHTHRLIHSPFQRHWFKYKWIQTYIYTVKLSKSPKYTAVSARIQKTMFSNFHMQIRLEFYTKWSKEHSPATIPLSELRSVKSMKNRNVCCIGFWINASNPIVSDS